MLPFLVSRPPLAQKVGTSPPQNRYGTSMASALATSPYLSCAFSCFSIRSWNVSALQTPDNASNAASAQPSRAHSLTVVVSDMVYLLGRPHPTPGERAWRSSAL